MISFKVVILVILSSLNDAAYVLLVKQSLIKKSINS